MKDETLHAVEMTREIRDAIYEETKELKGEDLIGYFREKARKLMPPTGSTRREAPSRKTD